MTTTPAALDPRDRRLAVSATGLLRAFNQAGVLDASDVHVATRLGAILGEADESVLLAAALAVRAVRRGSICLDLDLVAQQAVAESADPATTGEDPAAQLPWPPPEPWRAAVAESPLLREEALRLEGPLLYLDRYWREEKQVCDDLVERLRRESPEVDEATLATGLDRVFPREGYDEQRAAVLASVRRWTTILTGGPGTGKTTAVAGLLALLSEQHEAATGQRPRIALCAPTGKAAARLQEAVLEAARGMTHAEDRARVESLTAETMHRLLGWVPDSSVRFRHRRSNRLPHDVVVVDETSMVSLTMMARLLEALRPETRLVLVGDPHQLSSVEAGAVLADLVEGFEALSDSPVAALVTTHRYGAGIGALAEALRVSDADRAVELLGSGIEGVELVDPDDDVAMAGFTASVAEVAEQLVLAAERGDGLGATDRLAAHRLLCAHRRGPYGVTGWNRRVEQQLADHLDVSVYDEWYAGRPVLITANDRGQRLSNGDMGVTVRRPDGRVRVRLADAEGREFPPSRLPAAETVHAMTVHKSQGSQARVVSVVLPPPESRLLTRELFYTAVTRAQETVRVVGTEEAIRAAIGREVQRASGLAHRLRAHLR